MSLSVDKETPARREDLPSYSPPAPSLQPALESQPATDFMSMQSGVGNAALANTASNGSFALSSNSSQFQSAYGNAAVAREAESPVSGPSLTPPAYEKAVTPAATTATVVTPATAPTIPSGPGVAYPASEEPLLGVPALSQDYSAEPAAESTAKFEEETLPASDAQPAEAATTAPAIAAKPAIEPTGAIEPKAVAKQTGAAVEATPATEAKPDARPQTGSPAQATAKGETAGKSKAASKASAEGESATEVGSEEATEAAGLTASSDPDFQAVVERTRNAAVRARSHAPANAKASQAQAAAVGPPNDAKSQAGGAQVQKMDEQKAQPFDRAMFKAALLKKITDTAPETLKDADEFKKGGKLNSVKGDLTNTVKEGKQQAQGNIAETTSQAPDTSTAHPKTVTPLSPTSAGPPPPDIGAAQAIPKAKSESEVSLQEGSTSLDQQMADANVTEEQLQESNEPSFTGALETKNAAQADAASAPMVYREEEQAVLEGARGDATATAQAQLRGMHGGRAQAIAQVAGLQGSTKGQDEQERANVANHIEELYNQTRKAVEDRLQKLDEDVNKTFDEGAATAQKAFEDYVDQRVTDYKIHRYLLTPGGSFLWAKDLLLGLPDDVNQIYLAGRELYLTQMDGLLDQIAAVVETGLTEAKTLIKSGKQEIEKYVIGLAPSLRSVGRKAAQNIQSKFDALEQSVDDKQNQLIDSLAQKYNESLQQIDDRVKTMQEENRGLVDKARDALAGVFETILKLKNMLLSTLARAADAVSLIIAHPIDFLGNLVAGVKLGFDNFSSKIGHYLEQALVEWIFGALGDAGLEIPETFDLKGILSLVMQVLGLTYANIRARAVGLLGEKLVAGLETTAVIFKILIKDGPAGLWEYIKDQVGDLKAMVIEQIKSFVEERIIKAGIMWILSLLNPVSAFIKACKGIYDIIMFFVERAAQIMALVNAVIDSVTEIAKGNIAAAAEYVEKSLAKGLTVVIGFLAALLNLSGISDTIKKIIEMVRKPINTAIDWVINQAVKLVKAAGKLLGFGKEEQTPETADPEHDLKVQAGLAAIDTEEKQYEVEGKVSRQDADRVAVKIQKEHAIFKSVTVIDGGDSWDYAYVASAGKKKGDEKAEGEGGGLSEAEVEIVRKLPGGPELLGKLPLVDLDKRRSLVEEARVALDAIQRGEVIEAVNKEIPRIKGKGMLTEIDVETTNEIIQVKGGNFSTAKKLSDQAEKQLRATVIYNTQMRFEPNGDKSPPKQVVFHFIKPPVDDRLVKWLESRNVVVRIGL
jgi:hypothetical protein